MHQTWNKNIWQVLVSWGINIYILQRITVCLTFFARPWLWGIISVILLCVSWLSHQWGQIYDIIIIHHKACKAMWRSADLLQLWAYIPLDWNPSMMLCPRLTCFFSGKQPHVAMYILIVWSVPHHMTMQRSRDGWQSILLRVENKFDFKLVFLSISMPEISFIFYPTVYGFKKR